ncbi:unnamed protein product [Nesidiocoris tenuis]|uniref:Uncharacterized protein n=1 Tax=Nesidiocoris tenuis TaxID=355587 RepID=A0A6H5HE95_9HEMI|nr:unnamed protein product [Nesidiocoris tenuis]
MFLYWHTKASIYLSINIDQNFENHPAFQYSTFLDEPGVHRLLQNTNCTFT